MPKTKIAKSRSRQAADNFDGVFLLKMLLYVLIGSIWIKTGQGSSPAFAMPIGLAVGLIFTTHEHFRLDRKIEYALLIAAMLFGYFAPYGIYVTL